MKIEVVTDGLEFPEGPIWMKDGSILVTEIAGGRITRIQPNGTKTVVATTGGGPNGAAIGPDGALYVCNNGGMAVERVDGKLTTTGGTSPDYETGSLDRVDLATGKVDRLYTSVGGRRLAGPNDIVFDAHGGIWFSDLGKHHGHIVEQGGIYYAKPDGSSIERVVDKLGVNGIGLSPDGRKLYGALSYERQIVEFAVQGPGKLDAGGGFLPGKVLTSFPGRQLLDSLAVTADGHVCVATAVERAGIASVDPNTGEYELFSCPDWATTNICFGGKDMQDAWITQSSVGQLLKVRWPRPGLVLSYYA